MKGHRHISTSICNGGPETADSIRLSRRLLYFSERDSHLLQCNLIQRAGYFQLLGFLVFLQGHSRIGIKLSRLCAIVKAALLENVLDLINLIYSRPKDRPSASARF